MWTWCPPCQRRLSYSDTVAPVCHPPSVVEPVCPPVGPHAALSVLTCRHATSTDRHGSSCVASGLDSTNTRHVVDHLVSRQVQILQTHDMSWIILCRVRSRFYKHTTCHGSSCVASGLDSTNTRHVMDHLVSRQVQILQTHDMSWIILCRVRSRFYKHTTCHGSSCVASGLDSTNTRHVVDHLVSRQV